MAKQLGHGETKETHFGFLLCYPPLRSDIVAVGSVIGFLLLLSPTVVDRLRVGGIHMQFYLAPELHAALLKRGDRKFILRCPTI